MESAFTFNSFTGDAIMVTVILNKKSPGKIGILELDATIHESHEYTNTVTEFPVEKGFRISDHIIRQPEKLVMEGFVTNSPIPRSTDLLKTKGATATELINWNERQTEELKQYAPDQNRIETALSILLDLAGLPPTARNTEDIQNEYTFPKVIDIVETGLRQYKNMVITRITIPRDVTTGESLRFTCELRHIITVKTEMVEMQNVSELNGRAIGATKQAPNEKKKGAQALKENSPKMKSLLADGKSWIWQFVGK